MDTMMEEDIVEEIGEAGIETIHLLESFGVSEQVITAFIDNNYNIETLKIVERQELEELVQQPFLADRTKLVHGLNIWRNSLGLTPVSSCSLNKERSDALGREEVTATLLLGRSSKGKQILATYNECKILTKVQKKAVTHIIVDEFKDKFGTLASTELTRLAKELHSIFPTEPEYSWYQPTFTIVNNKRVKIGRLAKGVLHDRNVNYRTIQPSTSRHGNPVTGGSSSTNEQCIFSDKAIEEYRQVKTWIRHHEDEWNLVLQKWEATTKLRLWELSKIENLTCKNVVELFPTLSNPEGYQLIQLDFTSKFTEKQDLLFERWNQFCDRIRPIYEADVIDRAGKSLLSLLCDDGINEDTRDWLSATLLVYVLPSPILTLPNKSKWKPSYLEARDSFVIWMKSITELKTQIENLNSRHLAKGIAPTPSVIVVADNVAEPSEFLVHNGGVFYRLPTFLKALDVCFKIFKAYGLPYARESAGAWSLIGHCLYGFSPELENQSKVLSLAANLAGNV